MGRGVLDSSSGFVVGKSSSQSPHVPVARQETLSLGNAAPLFPSCSVFADGDFVLVAGKVVTLSVVSVSDLYMGIQFHFQ